VREQGESRGEACERSCVALKQRAGFFLLSENRPQKPGQSLLTWLIGFNAVAWVCITASLTFARAQYGICQTCVWPTYGRSISHSSRELGNSTKALSGKKVWTLPSAMNCASAAINKDGNLVFGCDNGNLYLLSSVNGSIIWTYPTVANASIQTSPVIGEDGTIYFSGGVGDYNLHAVHANGTNSWTHFVYPYFFTSTPSVGADGTIYVGCADYKLYAFNQTGALKWTSGFTGGPISSAPLLSPDGSIYVGSDGYFLYAFNSTGTTRWRFQTSSRIHSSPALTPNGDIVFGSNDHFVYSLSNTGSMLWKFRTGKFIFGSSPAVAADGTIYIGSWDKNVYALSPGGAVKWKYTTAAFIRSSPALGADGTVYIGSDDEHMYALTTSGDLLWAFKAGGAIFESAVVLATGGIIFPCTDGTIYALGGPPIVGPSKPPPSKLGLILAIAGGSLVMCCCLGRMVGSMISSNKDSDEYEVCHVLTILSSPNCDTFKLYRTIHTRFAYFSTGYGY
jgi:outer membrane protein assembly factor BamB